MEAGTQGSAQVQTDSLVSERLSYRHSQGSSKVLVSWNVAFIGLGESTNSRDKELGDIMMSSRRHARPFATRQVFGVDVPEIRTLVETCLFHDSL